MKAVKNQTSVKSTVGAVAGHPLRLQCFVRLVDGPASPKELAAEFGEKLSNVAYHVRQLAKSGAIEIVGEQKRRGAIEHTYRATGLAEIMDPDEWRALSQTEREAISSLGLRLHMAELATAIDCRSFDAQVERTFLRAPAKLDQRGFEEMHALYAEALDRTQEIKQRVAERNADSGEPLIDAVAVTMCFEKGRDG